MEHDNTGSRGITATRRVVESEMGWILREVPQPDLGIDVELEERLANKHVTGRMIAGQVKAGPSWFRERNGQRVRFRFDDKHRQYWKGHSLPVVVLLVDLDSDRVYWQEITDVTAEMTDSGNWYVDVPVANVIGASSVARLSGIAAPKPALDSAFAVAHSTHSVGTYYALEGETLLLISAKTGVNIEDLRFDNPRLKDDTALAARQFVALRDWTKAPPAP